MEVEKFNIQIDKSRTNPKARFRQLADGIKNLIKQEVICGKEYLPGERTLAEHLNIDRDVVHSAYKLLDNAGLIEFKNHKGHRLVDDVFNVQLDCLEKLTFISLLTRNIILLHVLRTFYSVYPLTDEDDQ